MLSTLVEQFHRNYGTAPDVVAQAPGRIEFVGNHTDYNGGTVLGAAIDRHVWVAFRLRPDAPLRFASGSGPVSLTIAAAEVSAEPRTGDTFWCTYPLGIWQSLRDFGAAPPSGGDYLVMSDLPAGAGLSSSAAIELATALAFLAATGCDLPRETLVQLARHAENRYVGVPCGILDQGVSGFGRRDHLVFIDCRGPAFGTVPLPAGVVFWVFNTHTKHALVEGLYASRHRECMAAAQALGVAQLADTTPAAVAAGRNRLTPVQFQRARHVVEEIARVEAVRAALARSDLAAVGAALTASHRSSQHLFENSTPELDHLVDLLTAQPQVHGARLTGGGFGGAVLAMTDADFSATAAAGIAEAYARKFGQAPDVLRLATADGAKLVPLA